MFGIGNLVGAAFKMIGLEELAPYVSMIANAATGNFAAVANDLIGIVGNLTNNSFLSNISRLNPLGGFSGGLSDGLLSSNLLSGVISRSTDPIITRGLDVLNGFLSDQGRVSASVFTAQINSPVGIFNS